GSRSASSSIEPLRSAKSTVTCLRSPSSAALDVRIFSARCLGGEGSGGGKWGWPAVALLTAVPHLLQNLDPCGRSVPHEPHVRPRRAPHSKQKLEPVGFSCWHRGHFIYASPALLATGRA